jgi:nucleotidyltransferase substrate binding protein (TIGR01987 family)
MERLKQRLQLADRALAKLETLAASPYDELVRDASIQRFETSFEAVWKAAQAVLRESFGTALGSPKTVIRTCFENGLLDEAQTRLALAMVDHRNLTAYTYNEGLANEIFKALPAYRTLLRAWIQRLSQAI